VGTAARLAETMKLHKYQALAGRYHVQPIAFEAHGCPGPMTEDFIGEKAIRLRESTGDPRSGTFFEQRISLELQRGNARAVLSTMFNAQNPQSTL